MPDMALTHICIFLLIMQTLRIYIRAYSHFPNVGMPLREMCNEFNNDTGGKTNSNGDVRSGSDLQNHHLSAIRIQ